MEEEKKKINLSIADGNAFFGHELSVNFNPLQFIFDFKNVTPRVDPRSKDRNTLCMVHNVIMVDPYHAKQIHDLLGNTLKRYETEYGKIDKPKALKIIEKKVKNNMKNNDQEQEKTAHKNTTDAPNYLG